MQITENASLTSLNSFAVSAAAHYLVTLESATEIHQFLDNPKFQKLPVLLLGGGSNVLFRDDFPGVVLRPAFAGIEELGIKDGAVHIRVEAGFPWHTLVQETLRRGYAGLENLSLIPGNVGAAPIQNIGAYGVELKSCFHGLDAVDMRTGEACHFDLAAAEFGYRDSLFKRNIGRLLIQSVTLKLPLNPVWHLEYGGLREAIGDVPEDQLTAQMISDVVCQIRRDKLPDPAIVGNAGSFFKNPIIASEQAGLLKDKYPELPVFQQDRSQTKLSAAWLIDQCGWKGHRDGAVGVSEQHALVLVNHGGADGEMIWQLAEKIKKSVLDRFGIELEAEPRIL